MASGGGNLRFAQFVRARAGASNERTNEQTYVVDRIIVICGRGRLAGSIGIVRLCRAHLALMLLLRFVFLPLFLWRAILIVLDARCVCGVPGSVVNSQLPPTDSFRFLISGCCEELAFGGKVVS